MRTSVLCVLVACTQSHKPIDIARAICPPPTVFEHAICTCEDLSQVGELHVRPGPAGVGSVGVNGTTDLVDDADVAGSWIAWGGFSSVGVSVGDTLVTPADVDIVGDARIHDAVVGGDLLAVGSLAIDGSLQLGGNLDIVGDSAIASRAPYAAPIGPPCGCDDSQLFDVATAVEAARIATGGAWSYVGDSEIHLATGSYYVTSAQLVGDTTIYVDGRVALFVDGSLEAVGSARWVIAHGAALDLFVSKDADFVGDLVAGAESDPEAFRLYVGGDAATVGTSTFYGSLYAPRANVSYVGDTTIVGSIFARNIDGVGTLTIDYGKPLTPPQSCEQPPGGGTPEMPDAGTDAGADAGTTHDASCGSDAGPLL